jgi:hypothetical protein
MSRGTKSSQGRCANDVVVRGKCDFNIEGRCIVLLKCSYLDIYGNVRSCCYLPNPKGRFSLKKRVFVETNPLVLSPSKFVVRRCC